ncbi:hypothetical protein GGI21_005624 [Coemansia aciculifera]|nr:hypothetical protein GGI21_005624 [Coemansia aciculifera]
MQDSDAMARQPTATTRGQITTTTPAPPSKDAPKAYIEFKFIYDDAFIYHDLPRIWEPKRWRKVPQHDRPKVIKRLEEHITVLVFMTDTMEKALQAFSDNFCLDVVATDPVLMINSMRVFTTSTIASLGVRPIYYVTVHPRPVFNREQERKALENTRRAMEQEQAQRDLEIAQTLISSTREASGEALLVDDESYPIDHAQNGSNVSLGEGADKSVRIKVRDRSGKDTLLLVTSTTSVDAIIRNYISMARLNPGTPVTLEFDDERLDPSATIGDTEIEDDDMLTAIWK